MKHVPLILIALIAQAFGFTKISPTVLRSNGSQGDTQLALYAAPKGGTVEIANGSYTWIGPVHVTRWVILRAQTFGSVNLTLGGNGIINLTTNNNGNTEIAGINFLPGAAGDSAWYIEANGGGRVALLHDCTFNLPNFQIAGACRWSCTGGVIYRCKFFSNTVNGTLGSNGSGSGCFQHRSQKRWNDASTYGILDTNGDQNLYFEDNEFRDIYNQCIDVDDNSRVVIRNNQIINSQCLTHGTTSLFGGRQVELYKNQMIYRPHPANASRITSINLNRWFWFRAGTGRIWGNSVDRISSQDWGERPSWMFMAESLTRPGEGSPCQTEADYPGTHWPGTGADGRRQISDPIYIWNNTGAGATVWGTNDQTEFDCNGGRTANVFRLNRDLFLSAPPNYTPYPYPHLLRAGGGPRSTPAKGQRIPRQFEKRGPEPSRKSGAHTDRHPSSSRENA